METPNEQAQINQFLTDVFNYLDRTVEFIHRPMSTENRWLAKAAPIVQMIFPEDVVSLRPIDAQFVSAYGFNQVYERADYVNGVVTVLQSMAEADIAEPILRYVDALVESYSKPEHPIKEIPAEDPNRELHPRAKAPTNGWR